MTYAKYRKNLPQNGAKMFLTDGGLETTLIFNDGLELPHFAAFDLLRNSKGKTAIENYFLKYINLAKDSNTGIILDTPTWRASSDWGKLLGYDEEAIDSINKDAIRMLQKIRNDWETTETKCVINGVIGPRGDGYNPTMTMSVDEAIDYHRAQVTALVEGGADMISAITMNYVEEAIGIANLGIDTDIPTVISFTVETDGKLPTGDTLQDAIERCDAETNNGPAYYMINCAHPTHFEHVLREGGAWLNRIGGVRANASALSHAELDEMVELDDGNPEEFGYQHKELIQFLPRLSVIGGCCGTDHRHVGEVHKHIH